MKKFFAVLLMVVAVGVSAQEWVVHTDTDLMTGGSEAYYVSVATENRGGGSVEPGLGIVTQDDSSPMAVIVPMTYVSPNTTHIMARFDEEDPSRWSVVSTGDVVALRDSDKFIDLMLTSDRVVVQLPVRRNNNMQAVWSLVELREVYQ